MENPTSTSFSPFRFLDLHPELRHLVYKFYYGKSLRIKASYNSRILYPRFKIHELPDLSIEHISKVLREEAIDVRRCLPTTFEIKNTTECNYVHFAQGVKHWFTLMDLFQTPQFTTIYAFFNEPSELSITKLSLNVESRGDSDELVDWIKILSSLPKLDRITFTAKITQAPAPAVPTPRQLLVNDFFSGVMERNLQNITYYHTQDLKDQLRSLKKSRSMAVKVIHPPKDFPDDGTSFEMVTRFKNFADHNSHITRIYRSFLDGQVVETQEKKYRGEVEE